jgi:acyl transferase domain-containing protein
MEALEPLAIIGLSCHFPGGATSEDAFWDMLMNKECAASELPKDRYNIEGFYCSNAQQPSTVNLPSLHAELETALTLIR